MTQNDDDNSSKSDGVSFNSSATPNKSAFSNTAAVNKNLRSTSAAKSQNTRLFEQGAMPPPQFGGFMPPPPPPMGGFPPPFPPQGMPMGVPNYPQTAIEYDENGNPVLVEYVYEDEDSDDSDFEEVDDSELEEDIPSTNFNAPTDFPPNIPLGAVPPPIFRQNAPAPTPTMGKAIPIDDELILNLQKDGFQKAKLQEIENISQQRFRFFLNLFLITFVLVGLTFGIYKFYDVFKPQRSLANYEVVAREVASSWSLPDSKANNIVKNFYEKIGGINNSGRIFNKVLTGSLHSDINVESFYCIQRGLRAYLKFNNPVYPKIYLLNVGGFAKRLETSSVIGPSETVSVSITSQLNSLIYFDEILHKAAFIDYASNREPFVYSGSQTLGDDICDVIEIFVEKKIKVSYFFSRNTKYIVQKTIQFDNVNTRIEYSDYSEFGGEIYYPKTRTIYINENLYGNVVTDTIRFNQDIMFPR